MSEESIDFEALYDRLSEENRLLRMQLFKASTRPKIDVEQAARRTRDFITHNYLFCIFLLFVVSTCVSGLYTLYRDRRQP